MDNTPHRALYERSTKRVLRKKIYNANRYADPEVNRRMKETSAAWRARNADLIKQRGNIQNALRKRHAIVYLGGSCSVCGYEKCDAALDFHHLDPNFKSGLSQKWLRSDWATAEKELNGCVLLCANCHREYHAGDIELSCDILKSHPAKEFASSLIQNSKRAKATTPKMVEVEW